MGCSPSQAVIVQSTKNENSHLHPTIFMVGEKSLQLLRELGELNFYQLAHYNEAEDNAETLHHDFAAKLENPLQYLRDEQSRANGNYQVSERSACKIKTDYLIHVPRHEPTTNTGSPTQEDDNVGLASNSTTDSRVQITKSACDSLILSPNSLSYNAVTEDTVTQSLMTPSHSTPNNNPNTNPDGNRTKKSLSTTSKSTTTILRKTDPLDEIISVSDDGVCEAPTTTGDGGITAKSRAKMLFGRNRVVPKRSVSGKYNATKLEHESLGHSANDS